ncbi:MAG TPA: transcription termination/antitermination NusG family protein [Candidatus Polarisedimenticolia bacterium]|nr:transcription termination/antitermination NusG family protein [Candidatus Polarisedimenticolia bacterium]
MPNDPKWHALWTHSNCEQLVHDQLAPRGFQVFLPRVEAWRRHGGERKLVSSPMFPGYLFLRHSMDKTSCVEVQKSRGLVRILGERWDRLSSIPDDEIDAVQKIAAAGLPALPYPFLREGQRMRVLRGPLAGVEGILVMGAPEKGLLVLSVELLHRSVAVQFDCTLVTAV